MQTINFAPFSATLRRTELDLIPDALVEPEVRRGGIRIRPRYAEVGQSAVEIVRFPFKLRRGGSLKRFQEGVDLIPCGLLEDAIDPRTEQGWIEVSPSTDGNTPPLDPPTTVLQAETRVSMVEARVRADTELAVVLMAADALGVGRTPNPKRMPAFDLGYWVDRRLSGKIVA